MSRCEFIERERGSCSVHLLCQTLDVSPARYYVWRKQQRPTAARPAARSWEEALKETFGQHKRCYGTRRLRVELQAQGHRVGRQRLRAAHAVAWPAGYPAARLHPAHDRFHPRAALRA